MRKYIQWAVDFAHQHQVKKIIAWFVISRVLLTLAGYYGNVYALSKSYNPMEAVARGWHFSQWRLLDIWGRWDSLWYMSIATGGYRVDAPLTTTWSNVAFFPMFPILVRVLHAPIAWITQSESSFLAVGVVLSNFCFIAALPLLRSLLLRYFDASSADGAVMFLIFFPTSHFFSSFYSESLFLLLSIACLLSATHRRWLFANAFAAGAVLTRHIGIVLLVPIMFSLLDHVRRAGSRSVAGLDWVSVFFAPAALLGFLLAVYPQTQDLLGPLKAHAAWGRSSLVFPLTTLLNPNGYMFPHTPIEQVMITAFFVLAVIGFRKLPLSVALYTMVITLLPLTTGTTMSVLRHVLIIFPCFAVFSSMIRNNFLMRLLALVGLIAQCLVMVAWSQFHWIG